MIEALIMIAAFGAITFIGIMSDKRLRAKEKASAATETNSKK